MFTGEGGTADKDIILRQHQENAGKTKKGFPRIFLCTYESNCAEQDNTRIGRNNTSLLEREQNSIKC